MEAIKGGEVRLAQLQRDLEILEQASRRLQDRLAEATFENAKLKTRANNQRTELRRLNRTLRSMWEGVRFAHKGYESRRPAVQGFKQEYPPSPIGEMRSYTIIEAERPE